MNTENALNFSHTIYEKLKKSSAYLDYETAFIAATGLPLRLVAPEADTWCIGEHRENQSKFCEQLNLCESACDACVKINVQLMSTSSAEEGPRSCKCFSGMSASAIPIYCGTMIVAYLKTGQVFEKYPTQEDFDATLAQVDHAGFSEIQIETLRKTYFETTTISPDRYQSMITLLNHFAGELSLKAEKLAIAKNSEGSDSIKRARQYIHAQLEKSITLTEVSRASGMSESHFCREFKKETRMTLTEYINFARILWAKKELLHPNVRVSEVAFLVGFQSLSQFNRCFTKFHGSTPTQYRRVSLG